ncbi:SHOCT domain-containing protein [Actinoplanes rectilineatus]|uniref:SHOCT domain-containing protein n=1 Tax=Actinoplanes rectilineatus TaxID=113571 RepID=UPI0005F2A856|nr:SHOCT domain-containing protein [Actinoplanes rectilineatus]
MGWFSRTAPTAAEVEAKAAQIRAKADRAGVDVLGALAVGHSLVAGTNLYLVVHPERLDLVSTGQVGGLIGAEAGRESIPLTDVSRVGFRPGLLRCTVEITWSGGTFDFSADRAIGALLAETIQSRLEAGPVSDADATLLRHLADLHAAGVLTDEEYAAKKAGLL